MSDEQPETGRPWYARPLDLEQARKQSKEAAAFFIGLGVLQGGIGYFFMPVLLVDAVVFIVGGLWLRRSQRVSVAVALALMAAFISVSTVANKFGVGFGGGTNLYLVPFLLLIGFQAVRASVAYHQFARDEDPSYAPPAKWLDFVLVGGFVLFVGLSAYGLSLPEDRLLTEAEVSAEAKGFLEEAEILLPGERIIYFFAPSGDHEVWGSLLTDWGVIFYAYVDGEQRSAAVEFSEISDVRVDDEGSALDYAYVAVTDRGGEEMLVALPVDPEQINRFVEAVRARMPGA